MPHRDIDLIYQNTSGVETAQLEVGQKALSEYVDFVWKLAQGDEKGFDYSYYESSVNLSLDESFKSALLAKIKEKKNPELKYIIVVGIGGSNLGTMALYQALRGIDVFMHETIKIIFLDTVSPSLISQAVNFLNSKVNSPEE